MAGFTFTVHTDQPVKLEGLSEMLERYANDQWTGDHFTVEQAVEAIKDMSKRQLLIDLEKIELACRKL